MTARPLPPRDFRFCSQCGGPLRLLSDNHAGHLRCTRCDATLWRNPLPVAGVLLVREGRVLLTRRSAAMERGGRRWAFPGGHVESGETAEEAALRETREEAGVEARLTGIVGRPHSILDPSTLVVAYRGETEQEPRAGDETEAVRWFAPEELPWAEIAFPTTEAALRDLLAEGLDEPVQPLRPSHDQLRPSPRAIEAHCRRCAGRMREPEAHEEGHAVCDERDCGLVRWHNPATGAGIFIIRERRLLLAQRAPSMSRGGGQWVGPGGHIEAGETAEDALRREVREEIGVDVTITALNGVYSERDPAIVHVSYLGTVTEEPRALDETSAVRWFRRADIRWPQIFADSHAPLRDLLARDLID